MILPIRVEALRIAAVVVLAARVVPVVKSLGGIPE
jgi:hypothetical protein